MSLCYHIVTYGCQMNVHDSEVMAGLLEAQGYFPAPSLEEADVIVLNTCCVRETAEERVLGRLAELGRLRRRNPNLIVVLAGCLGQQEGTVERLRRRSAPVDVVMGTHNLHRLPDLVEEARRTRDLREGGPLVEVWPDGLAQTRELREGLPARRDRGIRAWVTIMYGCDNFCSYCIVPYVRGRERSRLPEDIVREVEGLASRGYCEVVLLGQNVNSYGKDLEPGPGRSFSALLRRLDRVPGLARLRYTTSHPKDFTEDIIAAVSESEHVCENFHLPAQAGSDRILRLMNRGYTRKQYLDLLDRIRRRVPDAAITTDLIVGFPGETDEDFRDTLALVREARFASAFMFAYSPRRGTSAAILPDQVPHEVKLARLHRLIEIQNEVSLEQNRAEVGRVLSVLVEGPVEKDPGRSAGRTRTNKLVLLKAPEPPEDLVGHEVPVLIERATTWVLEGRAVT